MSRKSVSLNDRFDLSVSDVILTGTQAVVRLALMQHAMDRRDGLNTAGYITGYRGSPIASLENQIARAHSELDAANIHFEPAVNEDLAATALWGSQQAELRGEGLYDGVFGIWYAKGPGVDRSGDALRHANHAGTSKNGGVLALMGDDHTCESSTSAHQSEFAFVDAMIPVLHPAGVQEILDYGLIGIALSRYAGVWVGLKCVKDNVETTATVNAAIDRIAIRNPDDYERPEGGLNIRLGDTPLEKEERLHRYKRDAVIAFARANGLDRQVWSGGENPKIGIIATGKSYLDAIQALNELAIDEERAGHLGIKLCKIGMVWPLEPQFVKMFAKGLELVIVVEEKRSLIESQLKEQLYGTPAPPLVVGKKDENGKILFQSNGALEPTAIAVEIGKYILSHQEDDRLRATVDALKEAVSRTIEGADAAVRVPYFCAGCPHNSSTMVPEGAHAYAGIGCHYMAQWMDRSTDGFTQMGGEGANWVGEAPFSKRGHVFQNIGDGTYGHSGYLAIRAAVASDTNITFKILYNDGVALTGGQPLDGELSVPNIARQMAAEGVKRITIVTDEPEKYSPADSFPLGTTIHHRRELAAVQQEFQEIDGVTVLIYDQTCAAEKRRRRKRGTYPDPAKRVFINKDVCEGCGDCSVQSNCVAILPVETEFGRKRSIDQHSCNKDFSCVEGFCPSFITIHGGRLRKPPATQPSSLLLAAIQATPEPEALKLEKPYSIVLAGVGGTGVLTVAGLLGQAAYNEDKGFASIEMSGLAQKGGAVQSHIQIASTSEEIKAIRASRAGTNLLIGCDLVTAASSPILSVVRKGVTRGVINCFELTTSDFTLDPDYQLPADTLRKAICLAAGAENAVFIDARKYAEKLLGDSIAANVFLLGYTFQLGLIPLKAKSIEQAIEINNVSAEMNRRAFQFGRLAANDPEKLNELAGTDATESLRNSKSLKDLLEHRYQYLEDYQDEDYAKKYVRDVEAIAILEKECTPGLRGLAEAVAENYFKLLAYKDEYEVARLLSHPEFEKELDLHFEGDYRIEYNLAPPLFSRKDPFTGIPLKRSFGQWMKHVLKALAALKFLRGTPFDVFARSSDRRLERELVANYEEFIRLVQSKLSSENHSVMIELAELPAMIRGYGHIKSNSAETALQRQAELLSGIGRQNPVGKEAA